MTNILLISYTCNLNSAKKKRESINFLEDFLTSAEGKKSLTLLPHLVDEASMLCVPVYVFKLLVNE